MRSVVASDEARDGREGLESQCRHGGWGRRRGVVGGRLGAGADSRLGGGWGQALGDPARCRSAGPGQVLVSTASGVVALDQRTGAILRVSEALGGVSHLGGFLAGERSLFVKAGCPGALGTVDGEVLWHATGYSWLASPQVDREGGLFGGSWPDEFLCLDSGGATSVESPWSCVGADHRNSSSLAPRFHRPKLTARQRAEGVELVIAGTSQGRWMLDRSGALGPEVAWQAVTSLELPTQPWPLAPGERAQFFRLRRD